MDGKENFSYLDGVPFMIGPRFCAPRDIPLPFAINYSLPPDLVVQKYDYDVENKVMESIRSKNENKKLESPPNNGSSGNDGKSTGVRKTLANHGNLQWSSDSILQPQFQTLNKNSEGATSTVPQNMKPINLSDFENATTSPFDYMELQTINDLEELNTVFQGLNKNHEQSDENESTLEKESAVSSDPMQSDENQTVSNVSKSISFPLPQNFDSGSSNLQNAAIASSTVEMSKGISKDSDSYLSYSFPDMTGMLTGSSGLPSHVDSMKRNSFHGGKVELSPSALMQVPLVSGNQSYGYAHYTTTNNNVTLRTSKSIPDLSNLCPNGTASTVIGRSHTPPANPSGSLHMKSNHETFVKSIDHHNSLKDNCWSSNGVPICAESQSNEKVNLPDPYDELGNSEKQIVDSIHDMGFNRGQVSRTVKHLGTDQKKVIEHLCQIQVLEESGYDGLEAEAALHLHDYNKNEAIKFLDLLNQFQDLGFEKDAIKKALVQNKNDRDKVIDALLSS